MNHKIGDIDFKTGPNNLIDNLESSPNYLLIVTLAL